MAQLTVYSGTVKFTPGKVFETQYGQRINAVVTVAETGEEIKLWGSPGDSTLIALTNGQQVSLAQGQKGWQLLSVPPAEDSAPTSSGNGKAQAHAPLDPEQKKQVAAYIDQMADLYGYCLKQVVNRQLTDIDVTLPDTEERVRAVATTLFIQACRKFNL